MLIKSETTTTLKIENYSFELPGVNWTLESALEFVRTSTIALG